MTGRACAGIDPQIFDDPASISTAHALCASCPGRTACLEWALVTDVAGYVAGTTESQRHELRRRRGIAHPGPARDDRHGYDPDLVEPIRRMTAAGMSCAQIGERLNLHERKVARYRAEFDIPTPDLSRLTAPCGSESAYKRHLRNGEDCPECRAGQASRERARAARRRQRQAA